MVPSSPRPRPVTPIGPTRGGHPRELPQREHMRLRTFRDRVPIRVVSERLGQANPAFTMTTYQHVLPGMQRETARAFATILSDGRRRSR